jgi:tetratricopeptide (TPR) repeat protein
MHAHRLIVAAALLTGACAEPAPQNDGALDPHLAKLFEPPGAPAPEAWSAQETLSRAVSALKLGDAQQALRWSRDAFARNPESGASKFVEGAALTRLDRHDEAFAAFTAAAALRPADPIVRLNRARAAARLGREAEAEAIFTEAIRLAPDRPDAYEGRALARWRQGDKTGAIEDLEAALLRAPDDARLAEDLSKARRNAAAG